MVSSNSKPPSSSGLRDSSSTNVYHKQARGARGRNASVHRVDSSGDAPLLDPSKGNPVEAELTKNVRRFIIYSIVMAILLFISIQALRISWNANDRQMRRSMKRSHVAEGTSSVGAVKAAARADAKASREESYVAGRTDTKSVQNALLIARSGEAFDRAGKNDEAIARYREALDMWEFLPDTWARLGSLYLRVQDYPKAEVALESAAMNCSTSAPILNDLGVAYLFNGKREKAAKTFSAAMAQDSMFAPSYFNMALCQISGNDRANARLSLEKFLTLQAEDPKALRELAYMDAAAKQYADAMALLERALIGAPDWPLLYFDAAATAALMGLPDKAIRYLEEGEALTSAATVYRFFQDPAYAQVRRTDQGHEFEQRLANRARKALGSGQTTEEQALKREPLSTANNGI